MSFYIGILMIFLFDKLYLNNSEANLVVGKGVKVSPCSVGLEFYVSVRSAEDDCEVRAVGDQCCLADGPKDCGVLSIVGGCDRYVPKGTTKTLVLVAPILNPYQRHGYCSIYVDSKGTSDHTNKRSVVIIEFDTRVKHNDTDPDLKACEGVDEDPLNDCEPVDCDSYYNGKKPYFHPKRKRCVEIPECVSPDVVYNPLSNACERDSISDEDIELLKEQHSKARKPKDVLIIQNRFNDTDILDTSNGSKITSPRNVTPRSGELSLKALMKKCLVGDNATLAILSFIICLQCCLICALVYCTTKNCNCFKEKKVVRRLFNYRQDATVTTPLIDSSNMGTETDCKFMSDSSKVDQKIKCYKACQKERPNARPSLSDDILSKCVTRRDWKRTRSEDIPEIGEADHEQTTVAFEDEKLVCNAETSTEKRGTSEKAVEANRSSEREILCHSYTSNAPGFEPNAVGPRFITEQPRRTASRSTEKAAQACFSNDSIDEYLSERGMIYLAGENVSKFTFSSNSSDNKPSTSSISSKTSKNIVQKVLSMIRKKSKVAVSDPGGKKDPVVELLHMSKATAYSSSNDSEYRAYRKKDSRTSL